MFSRCLPLSSFRAALSVSCLILTAAGGRAAEAKKSAEALLEHGFKGTVQPFLETYCISCHGKEKQEAEFDLSPFSSVAAVVKGSSYWELIAERLEAAEMPPEKAKAHPTDAQRGEVMAWIQAVRRDEAAKHAGDPGPVLARRLSNAEYDYTIRDLTGTDIRPTKEFPVDPANQAGFDNSGESLAMSPALVKKYLGAARQVAEHLVLKPVGFDFAPHPVVADTDRDKWGVLRIVDFYKRQPTDLAAYFAAAWRHRQRMEGGRLDATLAEAAAESGVSRKYLSTIWAMLHAPNEDVGPIAKLQALWQDLPRADVPPAPLPDAGRNPTPPPPVPSLVQAQVESMRDYVLNLRAKIVPEVKNLTAPGIQNGSQTMVMWKNRRMAANRRTFEPAALQVAGAPTAGAEAAPVAADAPAPAKSMKAAQPAARAQEANEAVAVAVAAAGAPAAPVVTPATTAPAAPAQNASNLADSIRKGGKFLAPAITTTGSSATSKMAAARKRGADPDLVVPANPAERARYEAAFARFADAFPDAFFITERARVYLDAEKEQNNAGRLLSAGLHSMTGYFRDDGPLYDLVLDDAGRVELDRLWREFEFAAGTPQRMHTSFVWFERTDSSYMRDSEFDPYRPEDKSVTDQAKIRALAELYLAKARRGDASELAQAAITEHFESVAANILRVEQDRVAAEPSHLKSLHAFAERAYRRPLTAAEHDKLDTFYRQARQDNGLDHEEAMRDGIMSVLMSPNFCYRIDLGDAATAPAAPAVAPARGTVGVGMAAVAPVGETLGGAGARSTTTVASAAMVAGDSVSARPMYSPLSSYALASRLSYFLWSSLPDAELLAQASSGGLQQPGVLTAQVARMLREPGVRNFVTEFAGHWLDFRRFEEHNAVDRERFPTFDNELRAAMFEEPRRFLLDLIREERPVLNLLYGDYTFVNAPLAKHYGVPFPAERGAEKEWVRIERAGEFGRGGLLPMAVFLTSNSPGLRTSPVKRGYWVVRRVLGERIPPPPAAVPDLPNDEKHLGGLSLREVLAKHREDKSCASCHARFDSFGLVFEGYGPVGERRTQDFGGRNVDTRAEFPGGREGVGLTGLRDYIRSNRESDFVDNLCRKLLVYALGRTLLMSDDPLVTEMKSKLAASGGKFQTLVEAIVLSPQFRNKRVPDAAAVSAKTASLP